MQIPRYKVAERYKWHDFAVSNISDFTLEPVCEIDSQEIAENPNLTLYCLDLEKRTAVFVETPSDIDLENHAFMFFGQFQNATHVATLPFEAFHKLASNFQPNPSDLTFIHSVGRCGSTLISKAYQTLPHVRSLSEPDSLMQLVAWRGSKKLPEEELLQLTDSCLKFCCKPMTGKTDCTHWAIKFRSQCMEICDLMETSFPGSKHLYLTRSALGWLDSAYRAFIEPEKVEDPDYKKLFEDEFSKMYPLVKSLIDPNKTMSVSKAWLLNWISNKETQSRFKTAGIHFCEVDFSEIKSNPKAVIRRFFDHSGIETDSWENILVTLSKDSQAGSSINQSIINRPDKNLPEHSKEEARQILTERGHLL